MEQHTSVIRGLYAITPDLADTERLCRMVQASIVGGAAIVQYRNKAADPILRIAQAKALLEVCREHGAQLIINDHIKLCLALDADGVHIGSEDFKEDGAKSLPAIRERMGDKIVGVSCYNQLELAQQAALQGADYVAFGACFPSSTKPDAVKAELHLFEEAASLIDIPLVGIGGITLNNAPSLIEAGADAIAVINALWSSQDIEQTSRKFSALFPD